MHEAFAEERSHLHIGRIEEAALLTKHVIGTEWQPVVITGESGLKGISLGRDCGYYLLLGSVS